MASPTQQTAEYHGHAAAGTEPERVRVALVGGSRGPLSDDLYRLLRRRLLVVTTITALYYFISSLLIVDLFWRLSRNGDFERLIGLDKAIEVFAIMTVSLSVTAGASLMLWRRPPRSITGLRAVELFAIGTLVVIQLREVVSPATYGVLTRLPAEPIEIRSALFGQYIIWQTLCWFVIIVIYGAIIPNTPRRCVIAVGFLALSPMALFALYAYWVQPLPPRVAADALIFWGIFQAIAVAVVVFSSSRIEHYRRQASEARKLGQYVLKEKLGAGGMGEVYRAEHVLLRRPCALKTIRPEKAGDPDTLRRFEREVQITATLTHPNTVQVFDYGHAADGTFYYVMEYLPGLTLEELVRRHGPLPPGRAVHFLRQVCASLGEAHARGLTHRDIKPGNIMVCERGGVYDVAKVLDFGLVRVPKDEADGGTLTRDGAVAGTPAYMSPEQAGGEGGIDPRSDIYSVGAMAYFLLTGQPPFAGRSTAKMLAAHLYEPPAALPAGLPADLAGVVMRCLAKSPSERWPDAASLEAALAGTSVVVWTAQDSIAWWERVVGPRNETGAVVATATWAEPNAAPDPAARFDSGRS